MTFGIEAASYYVPSLYLEIKDLAEKRGIEPAKLEKGLGLHKMGFPDVHEDAATFAAEASLKLIQDYNINPKEISRIYLGTESALDAAKPTASYAMQMVEKEGKGVVLYMQQEGRGIGLLNKLKAYKLQEDGRDTVEANLELGFKMDERDYGLGAQILRSLNVQKIRLISNNPKKRVGLIGYGLEIVDNISIEVTPNPENQKYLETKRDKMGHTILK
jgi:hypothetical protein